LPIREDHMARPSLSAEDGDKPRPPTMYAIDWVKRQLLTKEGRRRSGIRITAGLSVAAAAAAIAGVWLAAIQIRYAADTLQLQHAFAIIDDQRQIANRLFSDPEIASVIRSDGGTPEKRRKALDVLGDYDATLQKFAIAQDRGAVDSRFRTAFQQDFCKLLRFPFVHGWWEDRKRAEPYASFTDSYKKLDEACPMRR